MESNNNYLLPETYRFFPKAEDIKNKKGVRFYYYGQIQYDEKEKEKLQKLYDYFKEKKISPPTDPYFDEARLYLLFEGHDFGRKKTCECIEEIKKWRTQNLPLQLSNKVQQILNSGYIYICGRDYQFRPIVVVKAYQLNMTEVDDYFRATIYANQFCINNMFLPGQVESWVTIYDLGNTGLSDIPMSAMKKVAGDLSTNYSGRLSKMFVVNAPSSVVFIWKMVQGFLSDTTTNKIKLSEDGDVAKREVCDKSQIQKKYGGTQPDITAFWPPKLPQFKIDQSILVTKQTYKAMVNSGQLKKNIIDPKI